MEDAQRVIEDIVRKRSLNHFFQNNYYRFGVEYFGPFLYGYTEWLFNRIKKSGCSKVFFFSRDGYMMEKAFRVFNEKEKISSSYVYFSRKSISQSLLHYCTSYEESLRYLTWERFIPIGRLLEYFGFSKSESKKIAAKEKLNLDEDVTFNDLKSDQRLKRIYTKYHNYIDAHSAKQDDLLKKYLIQIGMEGNCAIVDIGWHGSMQYFLEEYCRKNNIPIRFCGYYLGILPNLPVVGSVEGYLYNPTKSTLRKSVLCFFGGYEKLFQSCDGPVCGYEEDNDSIIVPILAEYEYADEPEFIQNIKDWQDGALDFVRYAYQDGAHLENSLAWAGPLINFGKTPTLAGTKLFKNFYNVDGSRYYYVSQKPLYRYKPQELIHALSNSPWKTGFMKSVFRVPFPYFWIYSLLRK